MNNRQKRTFQRNLMLRFKASGLTQEAFAGLLGIKPAFLSQILSGKRSGERIAWQVADRLKMPICQLVGDHNLESHEIYVRLNNLPTAERKKLLKSLPK